MTYDHDTGNIYWNPCMNTGLSPLYLVRLGTNQWSGQLEATIVDIGDVSSKNGVEQTAMFTIPTNEPETKQIPVEGIEITNGDAVTGLVGGTLQLNTVTTPLRPTVQARTWSTSDESVVTVDRFGKLTFQALALPLLRCPSAIRARSRAVPSPIPWRLPSTQRRPAYGVCGR